MEVMPFEAYNKINMGIMTGHAIKLFTIKICIRIQNKSAAF